MQCHGAINRALGDWIATQLTILGITPRAFRPPDLFDAGRPTTDTTLSLRATPNLAVCQEIRASLVGDERACRRVIKDGVSINIAPDMPVVVEKETDFASLVRQIGHGQVAQEKGAVKIDQVVKD